VHFEGVATIVAKLFIICGDCTAVFGRKDYQQLQVIKRMAKDLLLPVRIVGFPTVREPDGLAKSSRNAYLSPDDRIKARQIPMGLSDAIHAFKTGERSVARLRAAVISRVETVSSSIDYITIADADTLRPFEDSATIGERAVIALAARVGPARLIDNVVLGEDKAPCGEGRG
jgi:pantoate--beta-alanine ligase